MTLAIFPRRRVTRHNPPWLQRVWNASVKVFALLCGASPGQYGPDCHGDVKKVSGPRVRQSTKRHNLYHWHDCVQYRYEQPTGSPLTRGGTELPVVAAPRYPRSGTVHLGEPQCYAPMRAAGRPLGPMTETSGKNEIPVSLVVADSQRRKHGAE